MGNDVPHLDEKDTKLRLLNAAGEVFAEHGFRAATIRDICQRAGANIAAINYHFGGKEELYREVLSYAFVQGERKYPLATNQADSAAQQLETFIRVSLERMLDEGKPAWHGKLMVREMTDPTGQLDLIAERFMKPHFEALKVLVRSLCGAAVPEERVVLLCLSAVGQAVYYKMGKEAICRVAAEVGVGPGDRGAIARHIAQVTCAGAAAIRAEFAGSGE